MARRKMSESSAVATLRGNSKNGRSPVLENFEHSVFAFVAEEYGHVSIQECIARGGSLEHLADDFALVIVMLELAEQDAAKAGNTYVTSLATEGQTLLRQAATHFPTLTPRLLKVLARMPPVSAATDPETLARALIAAGPEKTVAYSADGSVPQVFTWKNA
jgi:hypothetical protein